MLKSQQFAYDHVEYLPSRTFDDIWKSIAAKIDFLCRRTKYARCPNDWRQNHEIRGHSYVFGIYGRLFIDLIPNVVLAADKADRQGNLYTGYNTEETPTIVEAAAFKDGIVIVR